LSPRSHAIDLGGGLTVQVLDLDALIDVKREAGREKDLATLSTLVRPWRRGEDKTADVRVARNPRTNRRRKQPVFIDENDH
jgi:hypothetical protein